MPLGFIEPIGLRTTRFLKLIARSNRCINISDKPRQNRFPI